MESQRRNRAFHAALVSGILAFTFFLQVVSMVQENQTVDEAAHLASGLSYWMTGDFRMNPEHPPLAKLASSLPLLIIRPNLPIGQSWETGEEWSFGDQFLYENRIRADTLLLIGRLSLVIMNLFLPLSVFIWAKRTIGIRAAYASLLLVCFNTTFLAHSRYVTTDGFVTIFIFAATIAFVWALERPSYQRFILAGSFFGLALASKFSALILFPLFVILFVFRGWQLRMNFSRVKFSPARGALIMISISAVVLWATYGFSVDRPIDDPRIPSLLEQGYDIRKDRLTSIDDPLLRLIITSTDPAKPTGEFVERLLRRTYVPAYPFIRGVFQLIAHNHGGHASYVLGENGNFGWWYYFPVAALVKTPLSTLLLLGLTIGAGIGWGLMRLRTKTFLKELTRLPIQTVTFVIVSFGYFASSLTSNINLGVRHLLPILPFAALMIGMMVEYTPHSRNRLRAAIFALIIVSSISSLLVFPNFLGYFNDAVGGYRSGGSYLLDSNLDWGQDLKRLSEWAASDTSRSICLSYFGRADFRTYNLRASFIPEDAHIQLRDERLQCTLVVSATILFSSNDEPYKTLKTVKPKHIIGSSLYVFN